MSDDLFILLGGQDQKGLMIYRNNGEHVRVKLSEIGALIDGLAAADDLSANGAPGPDSLPPDPIIRL